MSIGLKQAAQQALSALEKSQPHPSNPFVGLTNQDFIDHEETIRQLRAALAQQPATDEPVQADSSEHLRVIASLGDALRRLSFAAQTTGGTDGPDAELQSAIGQAEQALSLGGIWQAMSATGEPVWCVATGERVNGEETYTHHDAYVPLADCFPLYPHQATELDAAKSTAAIAWGWLWHVTTADDRVIAARHLIGESLTREMKRYGIKAAKSKGAKVNVQEIEAAMLRGEFGVA